MRAKQYFDEIREIIGEMPNIEKIDDIEKDRGKVKADYIFDRRLIIELKELSANPDNKIRRVVLQMRKEAGLLPWVAERLDVTARRTAKPQKWKKLYERALSRTIETHLRKAKKQVLSSMGEHKIEHGAILLLIKAGYYLDAKTVSVLVSKYIAAKEREKDPAILSLSGVFIIGLDHTVGNNRRLISLINAPRGLNCDAWNKLRDEFIEAFAETAEMDHEYKDGSIEDVDPVFLKTVEDE